jgi:plasmid replication initiation protein
MEIFMEIQKIKKNYLIEKSNILNEMRTNNMTLQELRLFSIYLSKINARDLSTRLVRFKLSDFQKIMDLSKLQAKDLLDTANGLLTKLVTIRRGDGGFAVFQLFKKVEVFRDNDVWFIEINSHDDALPLMFDFKDKYFKYQLWNALRLKSSNQLRMYEILKQYEKLGERTMELSELRLMLGIKENEYPAFAKFRIKVLESCKIALAENTDIKFEYETIRKGVGKGTGRKITHIKFFIKKNKNYKDQLTLNEFIDLQPEQEIIDIVEDTQEPVEEIKKNVYENHIIEYLANSCDNEFTNSEMSVIMGLARDIPPMGGGAKNDMYVFLKLCYDKMKVYNDRTPIKNRFAYFQKIVEEEVAKLNYK